MDTLTEELHGQLCSLELFIVMNSQGKFFRAKGYGGYGDTWTDDIKKAKSYGKIGQARSRVTWFASNFPAFPAPSIIKLSIGGAVILDEKARLAKAVKSKEQKRAEAELQIRKRSLQIAESNFKRAQEELERAKGKKK